MNEARESIEEAEMAMAVRDTFQGWWHAILYPTDVQGGTTTVLSGRRLAVVRVAVLMVFAVALVVYAADAFALWNEAHEIKFRGAPDRYGERPTHNFFGLTTQERDLLTGSVSETPGWYPVYVVARYAVMATVSVWIAGLIFARRPRHWMAYVTTLFILLAPWLSNPEEANRLEDTALFEISEALGFLGLFVFLSFLWLFPDGRFLGSLVRLIASVVAWVLALVVVGTIVGQFVRSQAVEDVVGSIAFLSVLGAALVWFGIGVGLQAWRYKHTRLGDRRLARWNLVVLVAIPLWLVPFVALHDLFSDSDVGRYTMSGFVWEQIHETLYTLAPAAFAIWILFLVRRQGWWDFQTLWNRSAVYGIGLLALAAIYGAAIGLVSLAASPLAEGSERVVAVVAATAVVAFAYGPLLGRVRRWVDDRWFPKRAEVERLSLAFGAEVRATPSPATVPDRLRAVIEDQLDPEHVELWTPRGGELT